MHKIAISLLILTAAAFLSACSGATQNVPVADPAAQQAPADNAKATASSADQNAPDGSNAPAENAAPNGSDAPAQPDQAAPTDQDTTAQDTTAQPQDTPKITIDPPSLNDDDLPPNMILCEVKLDHPDGIYTAQSFGPTLEEARDNAVEEACALPCAEAINKDLSDDEAETVLNACAEKCAMKAIVLAAACIQNGNAIYTEGAWSETNDPAPTNGEEVPEDE